MYVIIPLFSIDAINQQSLAYTRVGLNKGGFDWGLSFRWHPTNEHTWNDDHRKVQPFRYNISHVTLHDAIVTGLQPLPEVCSAYIEIISLLSVPTMMEWIFGEVKISRRKSDRQQLFSTSACQ